MGSKRDNGGEVILQSGMCFTSALCSYQESSNMVRILAGKMGTVIPALKTCFLIDVCCVPSLS